MHPRTLLSVLFAASLATALIACGESDDTNTELDAGSELDSTNGEVGEDTDVEAGDAGDTDDSGDTGDTAVDLCDGACDPLVTCSVQAGAAVCGACPGGYSGDGTVCTDIDECAGDPCQSREECTNTAGSFSCACPAPLVDGPSGCLDPISAVRTRSPSDTTTTAAEYFCLTASCSAGEVLIGGGFGADFGDTRSSQASSETEWEACFDAPAADLHYGVRAICALVPGGVQTADRSASVGADLTCTSAFCPSGTSAVGGGGRWPAHANLVTNRSTPNGDGWLICVDSDAGGGVMNTSVRCVAVETRKVTTSSPEGVCASAACADGETIVGGGVSADVITESAGGFNEAVDAWDGCTALGDPEINAVEAICVGPF